MVNEKTNYDVTVGDYSRDRKTILSLWLEGFEQIDKAYAESKLSWMYQNNPMGAGLVYFLRDRNTQSEVGVQSLGLRDWRFGNKQFKSGIMADFVVNKKHRSLGPALQLLRAVVAEGEQVLDIIYGFPNKKAQPIFKRAGYKELGGMARYAKVLCSKRLLQERVPAWLVPLAVLIVDSFIRLQGVSNMLLNSLTVKGEWLDTFDERFDDLWEKDKGREVLVSDRSAKVLKWRFKVGLDRQNWKIFAISNKEELLGYIVANTSGNVWVVGDFYARGEGTELQQLLSLFCWQAIRKRCESISLEFYGMQQVKTQLVQTGFQKREENPIYYVPCDERLESAKELQWYITGFDRDT